MSRILYTVALAACALASPAIAGSADEACQKTGLTLGMDDYPPYRMEKKDNNALKGIDYEYVSAIAKDIGCKGIVEVPLPWARQLKMCEEGELHLVSSANKTPEREKYAYFGPTYMKGFNKIFMTAENLKKYAQFKYFDDMIGVDKFALASTNGSSYSEYFDQMLKKPEFAKVLDVTTDEINAVQKTLMGRNQAYIGDVATLGYYLKILHGEGKLIAHSMSINAPGAPADQGTSYIMMSRKAFSKELADKFMASTTKLRKDGTLDKILEKYMPKELATLLRHTD